MVDFDDSDRRPERAKIISFGTTRAEHDAIGEALKDASTNPHRYTPTANAHLALEIAKTHLRTAAKGETAQVAELLLKLLENAEEEGVTSLPVSVGGRDEKKGMYSGEFGSTGSDLRLGRAGELCEPYHIPETQSGLSVSVLPRNELGNSYVMLKVNLPLEQELLGISNSKIEATLFIFEKDERAILLIRSPEDDLITPDRTEQMNREFKLSNRDDNTELPEPSQLHYEVKPNGIILIP